MLRITYDGQELDINPEQDMFWSVASTDLTTLGVREGGFNNTWQLPITQNNLSALGHIDDPEGSLEAAYVYKPVIIYNDGAIVFTGVGRVTEVRMNEIGLLVVSAITELSEALDRKLEDFEWFRRDPVFPTFGIDADLGVNRPDFVASSNAGWSTGSVPICMYTLQYNGFTERFFADGTSVGNEDVPLAALAPWFNLRKLAHMLIEKTGYRVADEPPTPLENNTYIGGTQRAGDARFMALGNSCQSGPSFAVPIPTGTDVTTDIPVEFNTPTGGTNEFRIPEDAQGVLRIRVQVRGNFFRTINSPDIGLRLQCSSPYRFYNLLEYRLSTVGGTTEFKFDEVITMRLDQLYGNTGAPNASYMRMVVFGLAGTRGPNDQVTIADNGLNITYEPLDLLAEFAPITGRCVGDFTAKDIVLEYCNRFGKLLDVNENTRTVKFANLAGLDNSSNAVDWTDKVARPADLIKVGPYESTFTYGDLARRNTFTNQGGLGTGVYLTETTTGELEREAYASPFSTYPDELRGLSNDLVPATITPDFTPTAENNYELYRDVRGYIANDVTYNRSGWQSIDYDAGAPTTRPYPYPYVMVSNPTAPPVVTQWRPRDVQVSWNHTPMIAVMVRESGATTSNPIFVTAFTDTNMLGTAYVGPEDGALFFPPIPVFTGANWQPLLETYQKPLLTSLVRPRVDKYYIDLTPADLSVLDFSRPIKINNRLYYLVLLDQFDIINQSPTPAVLLQLK